MHSRRTPLLLFFFATILPSAELSAQAVFSNTITGTNPNTSNPYTTGQTVNSSLTATGIGRGAGISGSNATDRYTATGWNSASLDANDYFTWTITPTGGATLNLTSFVYTGQASGTGPTTFSFRTSADSFSTGLGTATATGATITLTGGAFQGLSSALEFRLYGWGASSASGTFSVNDFTFNGSVSAIPEPSTYAALAGASALGLSIWRRRRRPLAKSPSAATERETAAAGDVRAPF